MKELIDRRRSLISSVQLIPSGTGHALTIRRPIELRTLYFNEKSDWLPVPPEVMVMQIAPLVRELILAAIEAPWDYKPGSPSERLALVLCDRLTFSNVEPVHLPEPRGAGGTLGEDHRMRAGKIGRKRSKGR